MTKTVHITNFGNGIANDYSNPRNGECSVCKHFDILTFPKRLQPIRGMAVGSEPTDTLLGNMILAYDGLMYGIGEATDAAGKGELYQRDGFGASDVWERLAVRQNPGQNVVYDFLVHFPEQTGARKLYWAGASYLFASNLPGDGSGAADSQALTFSTIGQGLVHPKDKVLYFTYKTTTTHYVGKISANATSFGGLAATAFALPFRYRSYCLSYYGDYLAIPLTSASSAGGVDRAIVALWNRDTSLTTFSETIPWGNGNLKVLNNLNGVLIGISEYIGDVTAANQHSGDIDKIQIKIYEGGAEPITIKEITSQRFGTTQPSVLINPRVNFIHNNRLYFSVNIVNATSHYGLWSIGKNEQGIWSLQIERMATNDGSETGVIAAAMNGDFLTCVHTALGTITHSVNSSSYDSASFGATSVYESGINPNMPETDKEMRKQVIGVYATYLPLPAAGTVKMYYRVDSEPDDSWQEIFTESTDAEVRTEKLFDANGNKFSIGKKYEFKITSTGGAVITGYGYKYQKLATNI